MAVISVIELAMYFIALSNDFLRTDFFSYLRNYLLIPTGVNLLALGGAHLVRVRTKRLKLQVLANCIMYEIFCFVLYTVHVQFDSLALVFAIPVLMTIVYGDILLTTATAIVSIVTKIISDVFIVWDPSYGSRLQNPMDMVNFAISLFVLLVVYVISTQAINAERSKHRNAMNRELERLRLYQESVVDPVTGIGNRRGLRQRYAQLVEAGDMDYTFLMIDMDNFKAINDHHGHLVGDRYLKQFALVLDDMPDSEPFRYGGDEFCLLLKGQSETATLAHCHEIQHAFSKTTLCRDLTPVTISFGAALCKPDLALAELAWQADAALYQAKEARGSIQFYDGSQ